MVYEPYIPGKLKKDQTKLAALEKRLESATRALSDIVDYNKRKIGRPNEDEIAKSQKTVDEIMREVAIVKKEIEYGKRLSDRVTAREAAETAREAAENASVDQAGLCDSLHEHHGVLHHAQHPQLRCSCAKLCEAV